MAFQNRCSWKVCNTRALFNKAVDLLLQSIYSSCFWIFAAADTFFSKIWYALETVTSVFVSDSFEKHELNLRSSHCSCSIRKGVPRNFVSFIGKHLYRGLFLIELQAKRLKYRCFSVKFMKVLETGVYERLLLKPVFSPGVFSNSLKLVHGFRCVKSVKIRSFFCSVFSHNWTECGEIWSIQSKSGRIRTRRNSVFGHFSRSVLYYNFQFRLPILTSLLIAWNYNANAIDAAIIINSHLVVFCIKGVLTKFPEFRKKHLH